MRAAEAAISFEPAGEQVLKGKSAPVPAYRALRVVAQRGGRDRAEGLEPPFVGRDEELRQLKELLPRHGPRRAARAWSRSPGRRASARAGLPGSSRSMSTGSSSRSTGIAGGRRRTARASPSGRSARWFARRAGSPSRTTRRRRANASMRLVADFVPEGEDRAWIERALLVLLGVEAPPPGGSESLFAAWRTFFEHIAERGTTVLVFEDLQWADAGLLDFIEHVLEWSRNRPIYDPDAVASGAATSGDPAGAAASATSARWHSSRSPRRPCASCSTGSSPGCRQTP